jgi:hypothetical protein
MLFVEPAGASQRARTGALQLRGIGHATPRRRLCLRVQREELTLPPRRLTMPSSSALLCPDFLQQQKCTIAPASTSISTATPLRSAGRKCATAPPAAPRGPGALVAFLRPRLAPSPSPPPPPARAHPWPPCHAGTGLAGPQSTGPLLCWRGAIGPPDQARVPQRNSGRLYAKRTAALVGACGHGLVFRATSQYIFVGSAVNSARPVDPHVAPRQQQPQFGAVWQSGDSHPETCLQACQRALHLNGHELDVHSKHMLCVYKQPVTYRVLMQGHEQA